MKKSIKSIATLFVAAFALLLVTGTTSKAATTFTANIKQTAQSDTSVKLSWDEYIGAEKASHYHVLISNDGRNFGFKDYDTGATTTINGLAPGKKYFVKVCAMKNSHSKHGDKYAASDVMAESEMIEIATAPEVGKPANVRQTAAGNNSVTIAWDAVAGATSYTVYRRDGYWDLAKVADTNATSYTIGGLTNSYAADYVVTATASLSVNNGSYTVSETGSNSDSVTAKTIPAKTLGLAMTTYYDAISVAYYGWSTTTNCDGYQFQTLTYKGKKLVDNTLTGTSIRIDPFKKNVFTKTRVRAYVNVNGQKVYGAWSSYSFYASSSKMKMVRSANKKKITLTWKKVSGVSQYKVYVSTKENSRYKLVKTLSSKKSKCVITKYGKKKLKKGKRYYVRLKYIGKNGKKKVTSGIVGAGSVY